MLSAKVRPRFIDYQGVADLLGYIFHEAFILSKSQ